MGEVWYENCVAHETLEGKSESFRDYLLELAARISTLRESPVKHAERMRRKRAAHEAKLEKVDQQSQMYSALDIHTAKNNLERAPQTPLTSALTGLMSNIEWRFEGRAPTLASPERAQTSGPVRLH